ncbi:MAG: hypothetical protein L6265_03155, partial [Thermoplasmatales archaeon]|nr:hypothetical protein [Thermoplasmatales archaeon]
SDPGNNIAVFSAWFETAAGLTITVDIPSAAGIVWTGGADHDIKYTISGGTGPYTIYFNYTTDGTTFIPIGSETRDNEGTYLYSWSVPATINSTTVKIRVNVTDNVLSEAYDFSDNNFIIDSELPSSSVNPILVYWHNSTLTITATGNDAFSGLKNVTLYYYNSTDNSTWYGPWEWGVDEELWVSISWEFDFSAAKDEGYYRFYSIAGDNASNVEYKSLPQNNPPAPPEAECIYDITLPTSTIETPSAYPAYYKNVPIWLNGTCSDTLSGVKRVEINITYKDTNSLVQAWTNVNLFSNCSWWDYPFSPTEEANYTIRIRAVDNASNYQASISINITYDKTAPTTTITLVGTLGTNGWYISDVIVNLTATDALSGVLRIETGMPFGTYVGNFTLTADGTYYIQYRAVDNAGNV